jgi:hypothetical protein
VILGTSAILAALSTSGRARTYLNFFDSGRVR